MAHSLTPEMPGLIVNFLYNNMEASGYSEENPITLSELEDFSWVTNGVLIKFNQWEFVNLVEDPLDSNMDQYGWVYYPEQCISGGCNVGFVIHGYYGRAIELVQWWTGWNSVAYNNDIILVYPQVAERGWDVDATVNDEDTFATKLGIQNDALINMVYRLAEPIDPDHDYLKDDYLDYLP